MTEDQAQILALRALHWMAGQDDVLTAFLGAAGTDIETLKASAAQPDTQIALLDFLMQSDDWVRAYSASVGLAPEQVAHVRQSLPGGADPHWT